MYQSNEEREVREFAAEFPGPNVLRGIALCESGRISWAELAEIVRASIAKATA